MFGGMSTMEESAIFWGESLTRSAELARCNARANLRLARKQLKLAEEEERKSRRRSELFVHAARDLRKSKVRPRKGEKKGVANDRS